MDADTLGGAGSPPAGASGSKPAPRSQADAQLTPEALDAVMRACRRDNVPLGPALLARGLLRPKEVTALEALLEGQRERHGQAGKTLGTLPALEPEPARPLSG